MHQLLLQRLETHIEKEKKKKNPTFQSWFNEFGCVGGGGGACVRARAKERERAHSPGCGRYSTIAHPYSLHLTRSQSVWKISTQMTSVFTSI